VANVWVRRYWFFKVNVSLEMVRKGFALVYSQSGAAYGGMKEQLEAAQEEAKSFPSSSIS